jgi:hypothetical protein
MTSRSWSDPAEGLLADQSPGCLADGSYRLRRLERRVRIRHSAVRILAAQPATAVSYGRIPELREEATFPRVRGQKRGLWQRMFGRFARKAANPAASLCSKIFQYPKFGSGSDQRPVASARRPVRIPYTGAGSEDAAPSFPRTANIVSVPSATFGATVASVTRHELQARARARF